MVKNTPEDDKTRLLADRNDESKLTDKSLDSTMLNKLDVRKLTESRDPNMTRDNLTQANNNSESHLVLVENTHFDHDTNKIIEMAKLTAPDKIEDISIEEMEE